MRKALLSTVAVFSLWACGGGDADFTGPDSSGDVSVAGTYELQSANGQSLPATIFQAGGTEIVVVSSEAVIRSDGNYVVDGTFEVTEDGSTEVVSGVTTGTWALSGSSITFIPDDGSCIDTGTVSGSRIILESDCDFGVRWEYRKK